MRTAFSCLAAAALLVSAAALPALAAQWVVAQDGSGSFRSIQGAIDAASYGDVVYVSPGVYNEHVALKDGVRVLGAGARDTRIRHAYGFDEVVEIRDMGDGSLERVSIERLASVLPGPAVSVRSAAARLIDCEIAGGQGVGVDVEGAVSSLRLERTAVQDNAGHGITIRDGARATIIDCRVERNGASGVVVGAQSSAVVLGSTVAGNARSGFALEGDARLELEGSAVRDHPEWGLLALGSASVALESVDFAGNANGGMTLAGTTVATAADLAVRGGEMGVSLAGSSELRATDARIEAVVVDGIAVTGQAALTAARLEILGAGRHGLVLASTSPSRLEDSTLLDCAGDGVSISSGRCTVRESVIAANRGAGVRVAGGATPQPSADLSYNNVWGNGSDYVGTTRAATDMAEPPDLVIARGELAYLPDSPCLDAGATWGAIGSAASLDDRGAAAVDLAPRLDGWLGATWSARLRASGLPIELDTLGLGCRWEGRVASLAIDASLLGAWGPAFSAHLDGAARWDAPEGGDFALLAYRASARWTDGHPWATAEIRAEAEGAGLYGAARASATWPGTSWSVDATAGLGRILPLHLTVGLRDQTLSELSASLALRAPTSGGHLTLALSGSLLPAWEAAAEAMWSQADEVWTGRVEYRPGEDALRASVTIGNAAARVEGRARLVSGIPADGEAVLVVGGPALQASARLTLAPHAARVRLGLSFALRRGLEAPSPNEPPRPAFRTTPPDPEAGKPIRFLADETKDLDGEVLAFWWDFGDGEAGEGRTADHAYTRPGTYDVVLTVADDDGAVASLAVPVRVWPADTAPKAAFAAQPVTEGGIRLPRPLRAGDRVRLDASESSDLDGTIVEYAWDVGADGAFDVTGPEPSTVVGPFSAGSIPITLRVLDDSGRSDAVMHVVVVDKSEPPRAQFSYSPPTPAVRDPVYFTDRSDDTDGTVTTWTWDFGDGTGSRDASPMHRYERVGEYRVELRISDDDGLAASTERTVTVTAVPEIVSVNAVWAVLVGISDYAEVKDLQYASADATAMARRLVDSGVPADHLRLLLDREGPQTDLGGLEARRATLVNVREALGWLRRVAAPDDLVVLHFSGHGFQGADDDGDERDGVDEFLVLWDTLNAAKEDTALRDDEFGAALDRVESEHVVVFFDGCYSGGLSRSLPSAARPAGGEQDLFSDFLVEGRLVFSASSESQDAFESDQLRHGIFTYFILDGLGGAADANGDGRVTAWELYEYVARRVPERAQAEHNARQMPQLLGEGDVRVLLAEASRPPAAGLSYRPAQPYAGGTVAFVDQSSSARTLVDRRWSFGDGATSDDRAPTHVYAEAGEYAVELLVTQDDGQTAAALQTVRVAPPGVIVSRDGAGLVIVSLGRDHGVEIGLRYATVPSVDAGATVIEITDVIDLRVSAARILSGPAPELGATLIPLPTD